MGYCSIYGLYGVYNVCSIGGLYGVYLYWWVVWGIGGGPERMGPRPPPWVPLLKNPIMVAVSFPPV